jgi:hypothetical protein
MSESREDFKYELCELCELVLQVLDAQKKYFKSRDREDLIASKQLEAKLRNVAVGILEVIRG